MAITTDSRQGIVISGVRVSEIGLSKTLDNYTIDEIFQSAYCGEYDVIRENNHVSVADESFSEGNPDFNYPLTYVSGNWGDGGDIDNYTDPNGLYGKVIWLYNTGTFDNYLTTASLSNYKLVTEWEVNKFLTVIPQTFNRGPCNTSLCPSSWDQDKAFPAIYYTPGLVISTEYHTHYGFPDDAGAAVDIKPYIITKFNGIYFIYAFNMLDILHYFYACEGPKVFAQGGIASPGGEVTLSSVISVDYFSATETGNFTYAYYPGDNGIPFRYPLGNYGEIIRAMVSKDKKYLSSWKTGGTVEGMFAGLVVCKYLTKRQDALMFYANCGIRFYAGTKLYKPIIAEGIVTGFTDDLTAPSDIDNWNGSTIHDIPDSPGGGGGGTDEDEDTAISTAGAPYAKGLVNYYAMTAGSVLIDHISKALSTWDLQNTGKDLYKNLVSCKLIKPPAAIPTTGSEPFTIYGEKPQYEGADITLPVVSGNPDASFGPYSISRKFNDFRDYAPYTRVSIFLPYCGWCDLPSHVVGKSVTVKYFTDIIAATVRAVVFCNNNIIAEAAGVMGLDIPFTADAVGMKQAGVVSGLTAYAGGALQTAAGVASIVTTKGGKGIGETLSGASKLVSAYTQTAIAFNENTTEISGKNGDGCCLSGATNIIIKIIRPKYGASSTAPFVPAGFAHSIGFVSNKQVRVGNVTGLLIADNVDTSGIAGATDAERAEIKRVLETGLIVNSAPE